MSKSSIRYNWYQTSTAVVITVIADGFKPEDVSVVLEPTDVEISVKTSASSEHQLNFNLCHEIVPSQSKIKHLESKTEISLHKESPKSWKTLEAPADQPEKSAASTTTTTTKQSAKNWDSVVKDELKEDNPNDTSAFFKQLYENATEEERRAIAKSYTESGGTHLNMNWGQVKDEVTPIDPPAGAEAKKWK
eukprot:TRINITY_DN391_c0_g1_i1.p2 TRINITY_DN391_c0_g1~~TRINITY_DN391_c0_g1_i1.p2  ORF type:complete len:191 (-),score=38.58 TRINITY_DN391_c0_g1_i1:948-1520(-)